VHESRRLRIIDAACLLWLVLLAVTLLLPILAHGGISGPMDILSKYGLSARAGVTVHNPTTQDQASEIIPWMILAWHQVHAGHLPLWNSASGLGMPLAFNWQSAAFGLPSLVGYIFPVRFDPTIQMLVTLVVGGTGVYAFCRSLHLRAFACLFAASAFELSGPIVAWLGWPVASVVSWSGWLCAATVLVVRGKRRAWSVALFAFVLAQMILAGQLDMLILTLACLVIFVVLYVAFQSIGSAGIRSVVRPGFDLAIASVCGFCLAAPLALPGLQLAASSIRSGRSTDTALSVHDLSHFIFAGFDGSTIAGHQWFGDFLGFYPNGAAYIGIFVLVFAGVAMATRWQSPAASSLAVVAVVSVALAFVPAILSGAKSLPLLSSLEWSRGLALTALALAVLAGIGLDALLDGIRERKVLRVTAVGFVGVFLILLCMWLFGRGRLDPSDASARAQSFLWPVAQCVIGLALVGWLLWRSRSPAFDGRVHRQHVVGAVLLVAECVFLVTSGASFATPAKELAPSTPAVVALRRTVGTSLVGIGAGSCLPFGGPIAVGILPEANDLYGIREFSLYDPILPKQYYSSWAEVTDAGHVQRPPASVFCPPITSLREARIYGIGYVLEPSGSSGPPDSEFVSSVGSELLFRMPGAQLATLTPTADSEVLPPIDAAGQAVPVTEPSPGHWVLRTDSPDAGVLRLRITDVPGIQASIDGQPLTFERYAGLMVQARIPEGAHLIEFDYRPKLFTLGIALAGITLVGLVAAVSWSEFRRRRAQPDPSTLVNGAS
jgi:hypothetical protein